MELHGGLNFVLRNVSQKQNKLYSL